MDNNAVRALRRKLGELAGIAAELRVVRRALNAIGARGETYAGERAYYLQTEQARQDRKRALERVLGYGRSKRGRNESSHDPYSAKRR